MRPGFLPGLIFFGPTVSGEEEADGCWDHLPRVDFEQEPTFGRREFRRPKLGRLEMRYLPKTWRSAAPV